MSIVTEWLAFMAYGIVVFVVGMLWALKERRHRAQSSSPLGKNESSGHIGTGFVDTNRQF